MLARMVTPEYCSGPLCKRRGSKAFPGFLSNMHCSIDFDVPHAGRTARMFACTNQAYDRRQEPELGEVETNDPGKGKKARQRPAYPLSSRALDLGPQHHRLP